MSDDKSPSDSQEPSWLDKLGRIFSSEPQSRDELMDLLKTARDNRIIDHDAYSIFEGAAQVADLQVREIMIPRSQMTVVKVDDPLDTIIDTLVTSSHSRFPVVGESMDDLLGLLLAKDLLPFLLEKNDQPLDITSLVRPMEIVPESKRLNVLLREFRQNRNHMVVVIDEYGGVAGLVTIEDVLEEIVGDIEDEYDTDEETFIRKISDHDYIVKALTPIEDFNEELGASLNEDEFDTLGGLVTQQFGRLPKRNEEITIAGWTFRVLRADNRQVHLLRLQKQGG